MALRLKPLKLTDIDHVMNWINDPEVVKNFQNFNQKITKNQELRFLSNLLKSKSDIPYSIFDDSEYIGQVSINQINWSNKLGRLSLFITPQHWNKGYAQKVIPMIIKIGFKAGLHKVWLVHYAENKKAEHLYKKLGFKVEGILKDEYCWLGRYHDMIRMAITNTQK